MGLLAKKRTNFLQLSLVYAVFLGSSHAYGQESNTESIHQTVKSGLRFLQKTQVKTTIAGEQFAGEWPSYMFHSDGFILMGNKNDRHLDSNNFVTSTVSNYLAVIYNLDNSYQEIPYILSESIRNLKYYEENGTFNFWPLLPNNTYKGEVNADYDEKLSMGLRDVRRPTHYPMPSKFISKAANVVNDADDTSLSFRAIKLYTEIYNNFSDKSSLKKPFMSVESPGIIFRNYRDSNRGISHYYNIKNGFFVGTGAYLTWLGKESNLLSMFYDLFPKRDKPYIPYSVNDLDCVVNTNILATLAEFNDLEEDGVKDACGYVNKAIRRGYANRCGIYYPNKFTLHYTTSNAYHLGAKCLESSKNRLIEEIIKSENNQWKSSDWSWDDTHTIANAFNSLLNFRDDQNKEKIDPVLNRMYQRLMSLIKMDKDGDVYFEGGAFFSGGTVIRKNLIWISDSVTTALILQGLVKYEKVLNSQESI